MFNLFKRKKKPLSDYYAKACYQPVKIGNKLYPCGFCAKCKAGLELARRQK